MSMRRRIEALEGGGAGGRSFKGYMKIRAWINGGDEMAADDPDVVAFYADPKGLRRLTDDELDKLIKLRQKQLGLSDAELTALWENRGACSGY